MSRKAWLRDRARLYAEATEESETGPVDLVGRDLAGFQKRTRPRGRPYTAVLIGCVAAALLLAALRVDILRLRYALMDVTAEEELLLQRKNTLTVEVRKLRDPGRLREIAEAQGFTNPDRVIPLPIAEREAGETTVAAELGR